MRTSLSLSQVPSAPLTSARYIHSLDSHPSGRNRDFFPSRLLPPFFLSGKKAKIARERLKASTRKRCVYI